LVSLVELESLKLTKMQFQFDEYFLVQKDVLYDIKQKNNS